MSEERKGTEDPIDPEKKKYPEPLTVDPDELSSDVKDREAKERKKGSAGDRPTGDEYEQATAGANM